MKIFVCTRVNDKDADTYAHNAKLVSRAQPVVLKRTKTGFDIYVLNKSSDTVGNLIYDWIAAEP